MDILTAKSHSTDYLRLHTGTTHSTYKQALDIFFNYLDMSDIHDMNDVDVPVANSFKTWLETLKDKDGHTKYQPKTCNVYITTIKQFISYLKVVSKGEFNNLQFNIIKPTQVASRQQKTAVLTESEVERMLSVAINNPDSFQANQLALTITIMVNLGLRLNELSHLRVNDFKVQSGKTILTVSGTDTDDDGNVVSVAKNMRFRYITVHPNVASYIFNCLNKLGLNGDDLVMQGQDLCGNSIKNKVLNPTSILRRVKKLARLANVKKDITPHSLRRTCATILYQRHAPVQVIQRLLGHENIQTTQRYIDMQADIDMSEQVALSMTGNQ